MNDADTMSILVHIDNARRLVETDPTVASRLLRIAAAELDGQSEVPRPSAAGARFQTVVRWVVGLPFALALAATFAGLALAAVRALLS